MLSGRKFNNAHKTHWKVRKPSNLTYSMLLAQGLKHCNNVVFLVLCGLWKYYTGCFPLCQKHFSIGWKGPFRDHFWRWSTLTFRTGRQGEICRSMTNWFIAFFLFTYLGNLETEWKIVRAIPLGWPGPFSSGISNGPWPVGLARKMESTHCIGVKFITNC